MSKHICSKCNSSFSLDSSNSNRATLKKVSQYSYQYHNGMTWIKAGYLNLTFFVCPDIECGNVDVLIEGDEVWDKKTMWFHPSSLAKTFKHTDQAIINWYNEAYEVLNKSARASAMLSRSCIQKILRLKLGIVKGTLDAEINEAENKNLLSPILVKAFHNLRKIGNIVTHPNEDILDIDISVDEASVILKVVELLITELYVEPGEKQKAFDELDKLVTEKEVKKL